MSNPDVDATKRTRKALRTRVSCIVNDLAALLDPSSISADPAESLVVLTKIQAKQDTLNEKAAALSAVDKIILSSILEDEEYLQELTAADDYSERINASDKLATAFLEQHIPAPRETLPTPANTSGANDDASTNLREKMPKLDFPLFSGDLTQWAAWWERFEASVHDNSKLSDLSKFSYLKSFLSDKAQAAINGISVTTANYALAVNTLKARFGKPEAVADAHLRRLLDLKPLQSGEYDELRLLLEEVTAHRAGLRALDGVLNGTDGYGLMLFSQIRCHLTEPLRLRYTDSKYDSNLDGVMDFIAAEVGRMEEQGCTVSSSASKPKLTENPEAGKPSKSTCQPVATLHNYAEPRTPFCIFCKTSTHESTNCDSDMPLEERRTILKDQNRCFRCFKPGHSFSRCNARNRCERCRGRHHTLACHVAGDSSKTATKDATKEKQTSSSVAIQTIAVAQNLHLLNTFRVSVSSPDLPATLICRGLIDAGSTRSYILRRSSRQLKLPVVGLESIEGNPFGGSSSTKYYNRVLVRITSLHTDNSLDIEVLEEKEICHATPPMASTQIVDICRQNDWPLADVPAASPSSQPIELLIGNDFRSLVMTREAHLVTQRLLAENTLFGWVLGGPDPGLEDGTTTAFQNLHVTTEQPILDQIQDIWALENMGIAANESSCVGAEVLPAPTLSDGRYVVRLPWKTGLRSQLRDNFDVAFNRLKSLQRKLMESGQLPRYEAVLDEYLQEGIIEKVHGGRDLPGTYYMPHRAVVNEDRDTTKLRIVFDASSHGKHQLSLNDCLWSGPDLLNDMLAILLRFRRGPIAVTSDITKAFLQIRLAEEDRNAVRFLWQTAKGPVEEFHFTRVIFGVTSSPALLTSTIKHILRRFHDEFPEATTALDVDLYMDDLITSLATADLAIQLHRDTTAILQSGGLSLNKWTSNCSSLRESWNGATKSKVLGLLWNTEADTLALARLPSMSNAPRDTKRGVLQHISELYDPLGFAAPFTIQARMLMQEIWKLDLEWDTPLPAELIDTWRAWLEEAQGLSTLSLPRQLIPGAWEAHETVFHIFVDASTKAFAAAIFAHRLNDEHTPPSLVACKARVAPLKHLSLPRLELTAALLGARLWNIVSQALYLPQGTGEFWTDSQVTLAWIAAGLDTKDIFVKNRVNEITQLTDKAHWRHCPGTWNPADAPSCGTACDDLINWWKGPMWITNKDSWPKPKSTNLDASATPRDSTSSTQVTLLQNARKYSQQTPPSIAGIVDCKRFSLIHRLVRSTAWVLRFSHNCRDKRKLTGPLSTDECERAEIKWIQAAQHEHCLSEIINTKKGVKPHPTSPLRQYRLEMNNQGLLVVCSRLPDNITNLPRKPILLPKQHRFTLLLIRDLHRRHLHAGTSTVLGIIRQRFWIHAGRALVKATIQACLRCKRVKGETLRQQEGTLPVDRTTWQRPFAVIGIDFAGPLATKDTDGSIQKAYVALFTCAITRAVHLELVTNLTAESFLLCLRRFISRRGRCTTIYSDNALTFKRACKILQQLHSLCQSTMVQDFCTTSGITWKFIVERAPWWGGFWERMVRTVKTALKCTLLKSCITFEELTTTLCEVEALVNSRPLTILRDDIDELDVLTPARLLTGTDIITLPTHSQSGKANPNKPVDLQHLLRSRELMVETLRRRWQHEYIGQLRSAHETATPAECPPKVGDIVIVAKDNTPQHHWPLAKVLETHLGRDGLVRSGKLLLPNGKKITRPIQLWVPLETNAGGGNVEKSEDVATEGANDEEEPLPEVEDPVHVTELEELVNV